MSELDPNDFIDDVAVIIVAGGAGKRLGSQRPKAFVGVAGETLLVHAVRAFEAHPAVDSIVLVVPEDWTGPTEVLVDDIGADKVAAIEVGGPTRAHSVLAGLAAIPHRRATAALVHDAARPIVPEDLVDRVLSPLAEGIDCVVPVLPVADTIKVVDPVSGDVLSSPARATLRAAQTPQAVRSDLLQQALSALDDVQLAGITDCASAVAGHGRIRSVPGDRRAFKVTEPEDIERVEALLGYVRDTDPKASEQVDDEDVELTDDDMVGADPDLVEATGDPT